MSTSIASDRPWPVPGAANDGQLPADAEGHVEPAAEARPFHKTTGALGEAVLLLLAVYAFPLIILLIGTPIALCVRILIEMARRF